MFIKTTDSSCINSDYIINLYVREEKGKHLVLARMIDGSMLILHELDTARAAEEAYEHFIKKSNKPKD